MTSVIEWLYGKKKDPKRKGRPKGSKNKDKKHRQLEHIEQSEEKLGKSEKEAEGIAFATVKKQEEEKKA